MNNGSSCKSDEVYFIGWKKQKGHNELFSSLEVFVKSYPAYQLEELDKNFAFGKTFFEDEQICLEKKAIISIPKPGFPRAFFWDFDYDKIDWDANSTMVIQRVLERGLHPHWQELVRFYGMDRSVEEFKDKISFLPDEMIDDVSSFFYLQKRKYYVTNANSHSRDSGFDQKING